MFRKVTCCDHVVNLQCPLLLDHCVRILFVFLCCPVRWIASSSSGALPNVTEQDFETGKWTVLGIIGLWHSRDMRVDILNYVQC